MALNLKVYDNGDHTCLVWLPTDDKPIRNCGVCLADSITLLRDSWEKVLLRRYHIRNSSCAYDPWVTGALVIESCTALGTAGAPSFQVSWMLLCSARIPRNQRGSER